MVIKIDCILHNLVLMNLRLDQFLIQASTYMSKVCCCCFVLCCYCFLLNKRKKDVTLFCFDFHLELQNIYSFNTLSIRAKTKETLPPTVIIQIFFIFSKKAFSLYPMGYNSVKIPIRPKTKLDQVSTPVLIICKFDIDLTKLQSLLP